MNVIVYRLYMYVVKIVWSTLDIANLSSFLKILYMFPCPCQELVPKHTTRSNIWVLWVQPSLPSFTP